MPFELIDTATTTANLIQLLAKKPLNQALAKTNMNIALDSSKSEEQEPPVVLDSHATQIHTYSSEKDLDVGLFAAIFSGNHKEVTAGVIRETKRYAVQEIEIDGQRKRWQCGVSLRMIVATTSETTKFDLSIPNIAAKAQLNDITARIGIRVLGFNGPLGELMPDVSYLNVDKFEEYMNAYRVLEKHIFGPNGEQFIVPAPIAVDTDS